MTFLSRLALAAASLTLPAVTHAAQFQASGDIFAGTGYAAGYAGAGGTVSPSGKWLGAVVDGGADTFDNFGFYNSGTGGLVQKRQVDLLTGNVFRFFDSFTNTGSTTIATTLSFFGNLGSDGDEMVSYDRGGLMVSCQDDGTGACTEDAVLALVSGDNGLGQATITPDRYTARFAVSVAPGQTLGLLNFAFLARDAGGPLDSDVALARTTGLALLAAPRTEGLTSAQIGSIANFTAASAVPEPEGWAMMIVGMGAIGAMARRRRTRRPLPN